MLFIDIETFPNKVRTWPGMYEVNVIKVDKPWEIASFAYKWADSNAIHCHTRAGQKSDRQLLRALRETLDKADVVVAQNGDRFDIKSWNARMLYHDIAPPSPFRSIDTLKEAKKYFKLNSYSLDNIAEYLGVGRKIKHRGFDMWEECEKGSLKAWREMVKYNKQDVALLERVYLKLRSWIRTHPHIAPGRPDSCPKCGSDRLQARGIRDGYARFMCRSCWGWSKARTIEKAYVRPKLKSA